MTTRIRILVAAVLSVSLAGSFGCSSEVPSSNTEGAGTPGAPRNTWYVSKAVATSGDGRSWQTAWNELGSINWATVSPGDLVVIDGGATSTTYTTTMNVTASGQEGSPIAIRVSDEQGRNGQVILDGGRGQALPFCQQAGYPKPPGTAKPVGIDLTGVSFVYLDGGKWAGIRAHGFDGPAVKFGTASRNITVKNLEADDNGVPSFKSDNKWYPTGNAVSLAGDALLLENLILHDNGGDAISAVAGFSRLVMRGNWLYNRRGHPSDDTELFNVCARSAGVRVSEGGQNTGLTIEDSIVGPGFSTALLLGDAKSESRFGVVHDFTLTNSLIVGHHGTSSVSNISALMPAKFPPQNWRIERVTSVRDEGSTFTNIAVLGSGHVIEDSVIVGAQENVLSNPSATRTCVWGTSQAPTFGDNANPQFANPTFTGIGTDFAGFDFAVSGAGCQGLGSSITSFASLVGATNPSAAILPHALAQVIVVPGNNNGGNNNGGNVTPAPVPGVNSLPTVSFITPGIDNQEFPAGGAISLVASASDPDGTIAKVEFFDGATSVGSVTEAPFTVSFTPANGTRTLKVVATDDKGATAEATRTIVVGGQ